MKLILPDVEHRQSRYLNARSEPKPTKFKGAANYHHGKTAEGSNRKADSDCGSGCPRGIVTIVRKEGNRPSWARSVHPSQPLTSTLEPDRRCLLRRFRHL